MSAGLPEKPNSLDILLKVALAGTESATAEKESDKSLSSSETYTPTHKPSSKKRPLGDISPRFQIKVLIIANLQNHFN